MPTYTHQCQNTECSEEWDDFYSIVAIPPTTCPKCGQETAKRIISSGGSRGVVELTGHELVAKTKEDVQKLKKEISKDANKYASLLGEEKYHNLQTQIDRRKRR